MGVGSCGGLAIDDEEDKAEPQVRGPSKGANALVAAVDGVTRESLLRGDAKAAGVQSVYEDTLSEDGEDDDEGSEERGGLPHFDEVGWVARQRTALGSTDATDKYEAILGELKAGIHKIAKRWDLAFILVPGLFCNKYPMYMKFMQAHLRGLGLDCRIAAIDTGKGVEINGETIAELVNIVFARTGKRAVLIGHSKGGCDSVAAVSRHWDSLRGKVVGVVCLQSPLGGTPIANDLLHTKMGAVTKRAIKHVLRGEVDALQDLTYEHRQRELREFPFPHDQVPIVTVSSGTERMSSILAPLSAYMRRRYSGLANDGMVACDDADLPASTRVGLRIDWDHGACAFPEPGAVEEHELVNEAAIVLLLRQVPRQQVSSVMSLEPVFEFWHDDHTEHTFHFGDPWEGERKNRLAFFAFTHQVAGTEAVYDFWHDGRGEHTFHCGDPREGERKNNIMFFAYTGEAAGTEAVCEFFHASHNEHTIHCGEPWEGEVRGEVVFYAFRHAPVSTRQRRSGCCAC